MADATIIWGKAGPVFLRPNTDRCKSLFMQWGMDEKCDGILPPPDAMDFINSMPKHWICGMEYLPADDDKEYLVQEIPLPQPLIVLQ